MQSGCRGSWLHSNDLRKITEGFDSQDLKDANALLGELG